MKSIGGFFEKFNNKFTRQVHNLSVITDVIKKHTGISVDIKNISISNGLLRINGSSLQKNEIFIKKSRILKDVEAHLINLKLRDIQ